MPRNNRILGYMTEEPRKHRVLGYPADGEEGPTRLTVILFFLFVCAAMVAILWFARGLDWPNSWAPTGW
jgi:hypothetical protein